MVGVLAEYGGWRVNWVCWLNMEDGRLIGCVS